MQRVFIHEESALDGAHCVAGSPRENDRDGLFAFSCTDQASLGVAEVAASASTPACGGKHSVGSAKSGCEQPGSGTGLSGCRRSLWIGGVLIPQSGRSVNVTHFFVIGTEASAIRGESQKTALVAALPNVCGSLHRFLGPFARQKVNLSRIVSRPVPGQPQTYVFFLEIDGSRHAAEVGRTLARAGALAESTTSLGSYPARTTINLGCKGFALLPITACMKCAAIFFVICYRIWQRQEATTITIRKGETTSVALKALGGGEGAAAQQVFQNDLYLSRWFSLTPPERATYIIGGSASGGSLQGEVTDQRGTVVLQKTYSGGPRMATHRFADDIVETVAGRRGIASSRIAFVSSRTGRKEIYTADYDGANLRQLTKDGSISVAPALAPDGSKLAYTGYQSGYADIYLIELASGSRGRIAKFPGTNSGAAFSPDGGQIACTLSKDGNPELYVIGAGGGQRPPAHQDARRGILPDMVAGWITDHLLLR